MIDTFLYMHIYTYSLLILWSPPYPMEYPRNTVQQIYKTREAPNPEEHEHSPEEGLGCSLAHRNVQGIRTSGVPVIWSIYVHVGIWLVRKT